MYYAIQVIGYGKRRRYAIQQVIPGTGTNPTTGRSYTSEAQARAAAAELGYEIKKCGDLWEII
jgi:hypothetical protein